MRTTSWRAPLANEAKRPVSVMSSPATTRAELKPRQRVRFSLQPTIDHSDDETEALLSSKQHVEVTVDRVEEIEEEDVEDAVNGTLSASIN